MSARNIGLASWGVALVLTAGWTLVWSLGWRLNTSASIPLGVWRERPLETTIERGDIVSICPGSSAIVDLAAARGYLNHGWCDGHREILFKPVVAIAGDVVSVDPTGISVNGTRIPGSAPLAADSLDRPLSAVSHGTYIVGPDQVWLVSSTNPYSFDSRYFGPLSTRGVRGTLTPWSLNHGGSLAPSVILNNERHAP